MRTAVAILLAILAAQGLQAQVCKAGPMWSYCLESAIGPSHWAELSSAWKDCDGSTVMQSPIRFPEKQILKPNLGPLTMHYGRVPLTVTNTSHAIKIPVSQQSAYFVLGPGRETFHLVELHFHVPAEHANVPGVANPVAELHLVHNGPGGTAAIAILLTLSANDNQTLEPIIAAIPKTPLCGIVNTGLSFDLAALVGEAKPPRFIEYAGSLTTPACTKVRWFVLSTTIPISRRQMHVLDIFGGNARPLQKSIATYCWPVGSNCASP